MQIRKTPPVFLSSETSLSLGFKDHRLTLSTTIEDFFHIKSVNYILYKYISYINIIINDAKLKSAQITEETCFVAFL